jgi:hypothetical protein
MDFEIIGPIRDVEVIAVGGSIRVLPWLRKNYGAGRWRKLKGFAEIRFQDGTIARAELHWYEAHGIGRRDLKVVRLLD